MKRADAYARCAQRLTGLTAGLSAQDRLQVLNLMAALVATARIRAQEDVAKERGSAPRSV